MICIVLDTFIMIQNISEVKMPLEGKAEAEAQFFNEVHDQRL